MGYSPPGSSVHGIIHYQFKYCLSPYFTWFLHSLSSLFTWFSINYMLCFYSFLPGIYVKGSHCDWSRLSLGQGAWQGWEENRRIWCNIIWGRGQSVADHTGPCKTLWWFYLLCGKCWKWKCYSLSRVQLFVTPWTVARQAPLSMGFSRQEYWRGLPFLSPGDPPDPGIEPGSPALQADSLPTELHTHTHTHI